ncbi:hypothetical protein HG530_015867 [Fusarium avenaceum]|nr:hypothetical protein DER45DRAFT_632437 [Fusarium avenaceum]KAI6747508.1 hypothetical protein HG530_015867 [Fusarium avenaceum]
MTMSKLSPPHRSFTNKVHHNPYPFISPDRSELSAAGKHVLVTGGGSGIGKAISTAFAQAGAASISIIGRRLGHLVAARDEIVKIAAARGHKPKVLIAQADLSDWEETSRAFSLFADQVGNLDIFVANAGTLPPMKPVTELNADDIIGGFKINVAGTLHTLRAAKIVASNDPVFINISSMMYCFPHYGPKMSAYSASKAAALTLAEFFAEENPDIHLVNLHPGVVVTDLNRFGQDSPELAGHFCVWLASPEARFLKNKFISVNWDAEELLQRAKEVLDPLCLRGMQYYT